MIMGRGEHTLVPEWLKGAGDAGPSGVTSCSQALFSQGESIFSRERTSQPAFLSRRNQRDNDFKHSSLTADAAKLPDSRRRTLASSGSRKEHLSADTSRVYSFSGRLFPYLSTADGSKDVSPRGQNHYCDANEGIGPDFLRDRVARLGIGDGKEELDNELCLGSENSLAHWLATTTSCKHESESVPRNSQASRLHKNGYKKPSEMGNSNLGTSSVSVSLATSMRKAAFERNFPSLGSEEKQSGSQLSGGHVPSRHGLSRPDVSRSLPPGLNKSNGLLEGWSFTALADIPVLTGNLPSSALVVNLSSSNGNSQTCTSATPVTQMNVMNMAETLVQSCPRIRTPSQPVLESQKLEELAIKQSRQLIPVTPTLPKTISADKGKPKMTSTSKVSQPSKPCINSSHRASTSIKPDMPKPAQGKLLVLKSPKDGGTSLSCNVKPDGLIPAQTASLLNGGPISSTPVVLSTSRRKHLGDSKAAVALGSAAAERGIRLHSRDSVMTGEDKRLSVQAQNRSEFFNALRKKAASNGVSSFGCDKSESLSAQKNEQMKLDECDPIQNVNHFEVHENHSGENALCDSILGSQQIISELDNGNLVSRAADGLVSEESGALFIDSTLSDESAGCRDSSIICGSEEEEAAFLRSLGWEENAEGDEALTEEEINAFYQMRAKFNQITATKPALNNSQQQIGNVGTISSSFSSSDSESDGEALM